MSDFIDTNPNQEKSKKANNKTQITQKKIIEYVKGKKKIYSKLMKFLDDSENDEKIFQNLINIFSKQEQEEENKEKLEDFLHLLTNIADNCHHDESLFKKIFQIIDHFEYQIKQNFSNHEIFNIFGNNKKVLLYLFNQKIITVDDSILNTLLSKIDQNGYPYCYFFYPEIKNFVSKEKVDDIEKVSDIEKELLEIDSTIFDSFEEKRESGENDTYICTLIRNDSVEEFIAFINRTNTSLNSTIKPSLFETNLFLIENKKTSLIEYAAFFASIQIYNYLANNKAEITPSLLLYAVHSRNAEMFYLLESEKKSPQNKMINRYDDDEEEDDDENEFEFDDEDEDDFEDENESSLFNKFFDCFCESIKCHHNEFSEYIESNYLQENNHKTRKNIKFLSSVFQSRNYSYFPYDFSSGEEFFYLCLCNYNELVKLFMKKKEIHIRKMMSKKI